MKLVYSILFTAAMLLAGPVDEKQFAEHMKTIQKNMGEVKKGLEGNAADAVAPAQAIAKAFKASNGYWKANKVTDAMDWTKEASSNAELIAKSAKKGDVEAAKAAFGKVGGSCKTCHTAHREKAADGSYKIK